MKRWKLTKNGKVMLWTFYSQNGLSWIESDRGDVLKVRDFGHAEELINYQVSKYGWHKEIFYSNLISV